MWYKSPVILVLMVGKKQKKAHIDSAIDSTIDNNIYFYSSRWYCEP